MHQRTVSIKLRKRELTTTSSATKYPYNVHDNELKKDIKLGLKGKDAVDLSLITFPRVARGAPINNTVAKHPIRPMASSCSDIASTVTKILTNTKILYINLFVVGDIASYEQMHPNPINAPVTLGT